MINNHTILNNPLRINTQCFTHNVISALPVGPLLPYLSGIPVLSATHGFYLSEAKAEPEGNYVEKVESDDDSNKHSDCL